MQDAVCAQCAALFLRALRVIQGFPLNARKQTDFILALLRGHKGHLEEGRGNLGTPFAPGATPCSREHSGLFRVFPRRRGNTHLAQDVLSAERCLPREGVPTRAPYAALTFGAPRTWVLSPGLSSRGLPGAPAASEEPGEPEPEIRAQGP